MSEREKALEVVAAALVKRMQRACDRTKPYKGRDGGVIATSIDWHGLMDLWNEAEAALALPATPSQRLDAATVERCAIRDYLTACAAVADTQAERFAGHDASIVAACRAEAKAYRNAARMIEAQDHAPRREQIAAALATEPHQHGGKGA